MPEMGTMQQINSEPLRTATVLTPQSQAEQYAREAQQAAAQAAQSATDAQTAAASAEQAVAGAVKYSEAQTLTAAQQAQARANIGAADTAALAAKQDAPAIAGTEGQVLTIDDQGDPIWATPTDAVSRQEFDALAEDVDWKAPAIIASAGPADIVSITDGAEDAPVKSLVVGIEPVQDLHGYDHPWPAGGGKNKCLLDAETITKPSWYTGGWTGTTLNNRNGINQDRGYTQGGAGGFTISGLSSGIYTFSMTFTGETTYCIFYANSTTDGADSVTLVNNECMSKSGTRYSYTFEVPSGSIQVVIRPTIYTATTEYVLEDIQVESGSTATAWTPYSNICPITGWDGVQVWDDPKYGGTIKRNQLFPLQNVSFTGTNFTVTSARDGAFVVTATATASNTTSNNIASVGDRTFTAGHIYAFLGTKHGIQIDLKGYSLYADTVFRCRTPQYNNVTFVFTNLPSGTYRVYPMLFDLTEMFGATKAEEILAMGSSAGAAFVKALFPEDYYDYDTSYEETCVSAVNGDVYRHVEVEFPTESGTVYGGTLDVVSGELVVDRAEIDLGTRTWDKTSGGFYCNGIPDALPGTESLRYDHIQCSPYKAVNAPSVAGLQNGECSIDGGKHIQIKDLRYTDASTFKTAMSGIQLVYELEEPITYHLTAPQVRTLLGANNIWADAGPVSVEYTADTKMYIDSQARATRSLIAGIETDLTASRPYATGDLLIVGDTLYKAAASIASGATLTPGTNVTPTTVAEQLILLANA